MSTHNIYFYGELTKIILQLSSNILLTCSTDSPNQTHSFWQLSFNKQKQAFHKNREFSSHIYATQRDLGKRHRSGDQIPSDWGLPALFALQEFLRIKK